MSRAINTWKHCSVGLLASICLLLGACSQTGDEAASLGPQRVQQLDAGKAKQMAYSHDISVEVADDKIAGLHDQVIQACTNVPEQGCQLLDSDLTGGNYPHASLTLRSPPAGIQDIMTLLRTEAGVVQQSLNAEDLSGPVQDTDRRIAMLEDYRARLETLRSRADTDIDALIKVNKELADIQSQLEAANGERQHLLKRIATEVLTIRISSFTADSFWGVIREALGDFSGNLADGLASAITAFAYLVPWGVMMAGVIWLAATCWQRFRRKRPTRMD